MLKLSVKKKSKIVNSSDIARLAAPKAAQMLYNMISIGPRVILRSAFQLLRANIVTRVLSAIVLIAFDTISLLRGRISKKQYIINLGLALMLLVGGTAGWTLGTEVVALIVAEGVILGIIAGMIGAGVFATLLGMAWERVIKIFIQDDEADMLDICNGEFVVMVQENALSDAEADEVAELVEIDSTEIGKMFIQKDKAAYARGIIEPCLKAVLEKRGGG